MSQPYNESMQNLADRFLAETGRESATTRELAVWAIQNDLWQAPRDLVVKKCREDFAKALREQYIADDFGRPVRAKHVARITRGDRQMHLWADIRNASRKHMEIAFNQRREQIVGDCRQLDRDAEYYNRNHPGQKPVQLPFDFRDDVEEGRFGKDYPKTPPESGAA